MKQKLHSFVITVRMDKACPQYVALREARDCIHGDFYCTPFGDGDPENIQGRPHHQVAEGSTPMTPASYERDLTFLLIGIAIGAAMAIGWTWT